jgi:phosphorylcholine metabolism protein LicD
MGKESFALIIFRNLKPVSFSSMAGTITLTGKYAQLGEKMLQDVTAILESEKIPYVLEGGTLLGIVREDRLLPWDNDLDLTITRPHCKKLLAARWKFWLKGYRTRIRKIKSDTQHFRKGEARILKVQTTRFFLFKDVSLMDIFIKDLVDERYYWTVSEKEVLKSAPRHYYENFTQFSFRNKLYSIPEQFDAYLQSRYGDWRIAKQSWDFTKDDLSIEAKHIKSENK